MKIKISVIMLTYNREQFIGRAIQSVLNQDFKDFEYIIVDNGSTDSSGMIADEYARKDKRIKVIHKEKGNIGSGRNAGLDLARGKYVTFVDDDDIAYKDMLGFLYELAEGNKADIAICGSDKEVENEIIPNCVFQELLIMGAGEAIIELLKRKKYNAASPTKLWHRSIFDNIRFLNEGKYDDITIVYKLFAEAKKVVAHGIPKYCFSRHQGNNSAFTTNDSLLNPDQLNEYFSAFRERTLYLSKKLPEIADYAQYSEWSYMISMCNKIHKNFLEGCKQQLSWIERELAENFDEFYGMEYIQDFEKEFLELYIAPL
ncbi:glycosyltransferase family 2 protein [Aminipila sp.]|uniref:glycosyltransferase family 2 protein n=1 Tax=Aminipila sp. TaxID=2060095 RepID=UPI00289B2EFE|nr:glycosyltransferase [Aminipila sp.]